MDKNDALEYLVKIGEVESSEKALLRVCFQQDTYIDKKSLLQFFRDRIELDISLDDDAKAIVNYINVLQNDSNEYNVFLRTLKERVLSEIRNSLGYTTPDDNEYATLSPNVFWPMTVIAMKKCLGESNAKAEIIDRNGYYKLISAPLNASQIRIHEKCIDLFAINVEGISAKSWKDLRKYLHPIRTKNKKNRTRKKNLQRVEKRIKRIMLVYKLSHNGIQGNIFSEERYLVPEQLADNLRKIFFKSLSQERLERLVLMLKINKTLLTALFLAPNPQPERSDVAVLFRTLHSRMFPTSEYFLQYLQAQNIDKQYELATKIIQSLCLYANFPPPYYVLNDVLCIENYQKNLSNKRDKHIPRDHYLHIVNLYLLGIYLFFYNSEFYSRITYDNLFERKNSRTEDSKIDCVKDFISEWKYFCLFHDVGYTAEILGNKKIANSREEIFNSLKKAGEFRASFQKGNLLIQTSHLCSIEIITKLFLALFVIENSKEIIYSKHRIFRDVRNTTFLCYDQVSGKSHNVPFEKISQIYSGNRRLEKIYSNQCLKTLLPIWEEKNISIIGFDKNSRQIVFLSYCVNNSRELAVLPDHKTDADILRLLREPSLLFFDDFNSSYEIEYYLCSNDGVERLYQFISEDNLKRSFITVSRKLGDKYLNISNAQQFWDFQFDLFMWLNDRTEPFTLTGPLHDHLNSWHYGLDNNSSEAVGFDAKRSQLIASALNEKHLNDINKICINYIEKQIEQKNKRISRKSKNAQEILKRSIDSFYKQIVAIASDPKIKYALLSEIKGKQLELIEDDITLLELYSQIYVKTLYTFNKTEKLFCYDYLRCKTMSSHFLSKCINDKAKKQFMGNTVSKIQRDYKIPYDNTSDHGIFSAQYAAGVFELYRNALEKANDPQEMILLSILLNISGDFASKKEKYISNYDHIFQKTLYAIYIHNLYPACFRDTSLSCYKTNITEPFSYFALTCDALQQWNRPHTLFPAALVTRPNEDTSEEYDIQIVQNHIFIYDRSTPRTEANINSTINGMSTYMSEIKAYLSKGQ